MKIREGRALYRAYNFCLAMEAGRELHEVVAQERMLFPWVHQVCFFLSKATRACFDQCIESKAGRW